MRGWKGNGGDGHGGAERESRRGREREREGDLQTNVHKQTDCQKRTGLGQTEGQINRRTDSAKANKQRQTGL